MNKISIKKMCGLAVLTILSFLSVQAQSLNGFEAVNQLKKNGDYESLKFAFDMARNNFADELLTPNSVIQTAILTSSDGTATDRFGDSVSISGDTVVVGDSLHDVGGISNTGAAYVFVKSGTTWTQQAILTEPNGVVNDLFGSSVSIDGNTIVVGSPWKWVGTPSSQLGAVYVFVRNGATWTQQIRLTRPPPLSTTTGYGQSVLISGDTLIVGEPKVGSGDTDSAVFVYARNGTVWSFQQKLTAADFSAGDSRFSYGSSVSISGNTLITGDQIQKNGTTQFLGAAYIYVQNGSIWTPQQKLSPSDLAPLNYFGNSVSIDGNTAIIGSSESLNGAGSAYIYTRSGTTWTLQQKLTASGLNGYYRFGSTVKIIGDTAFVSTNYYYNQPGQFYVNKVFIFTRIASTWTEQERFAQNNAPTTGSYFGWSMATDGTNIIVGDIRKQNSNGSQGAAFVFNRNVTANVTVQTNPSGRDFTVDGVTYNSAQIFNWELNSIHTIGTTSSQAGTVGTQYAWANWSDSGAISHTIKANGNATYTANFNTQYQLTMVANGGGTVSPASSGFYNAGQTVPISATPNSGFAFFNWSGLGNGSYEGTNNPATVTMNSPITQTANFRSLCSYTLSPSKASFYKSGGNGNFNVTDSNGCGWGIVSNAPWITASITGSTVNYTVDANNEGAPRSGTITILPGIIFTVFQSNSGTPFDFDGDRKTDVSIFRPAPGEWWYLKSSDGGNRAFQFGNSTDKIMPADFTGDGKTDVAFFRPSTGQWFILRSEDSSFYAFPFGTSTDIPAPADYDGDGKTDAAVFRPSNLTWYINKSSGGTDIVGFGAANDKPVVGDYDGDGKADIAIFRPNGANGAEWWIRRSSNGSVFALQFGNSTDKPVQGDFTGDGKTDVAFWRPSNGNWFVLRSEDSSFYAFPFGANGDSPVAGDYDGDGKTDAGVFRPSNSTWFVNRSTAGTLIQQFGISGDLAVPNAFVP